MATPEEIRATIDQYVARFSAGDAAGWVALFADDARQEDPVGAPVNVGHDAIGAFYETMLSLGGPQLSFVREPIILGNEAVVFLQAVSGEGPTAALLPFICDHMTFTDDARIASLQAFWDPASMTIGTA